VRGHDVVDDRKAEPASFDVVDQPGPHSVEALEDPPLLVGRDRGAELRLRLPRARNGA